MRKALLLIVLSLASLNVRAAWYQVEIIIFENLYPQSDGELWSDPRELPVLGDAVELAPVDAVGNDPVAFKKLRSSQFKLSGVYKELSFSRNYRPLLHLSWQQPGRSGSRATAVRIRDILNPESDIAAERQIKVDGTIRLRVSRFLHMDVDLVYLLENLSAINRTNAVEDTVATPRASYTRLRESRRMKLNELHYFDHPLFGIITRVSRLKIE